MGKDGPERRDGAVRGGNGGAERAGRLGKGGVVEDPRFASMHKDPRFSRFPTKKGTVAIDSRFSGMFSDPDFQTKAAVDKRGRKVKDGKRGEDLKRYYHLKDEEDWKDAGKEAAAADPASASAAGEAGAGQNGAAAGLDAGDGSKGRRAHKAAAEPKTGAVGKARKKQKAVKHSTGGAGNNGATVLAAGNNGNAAAQKGGAGKAEAKAIMQEKGKDAGKQRVAEQEEEDEGQEEEEVQAGSEDGQEREGGVDDEEGSADSDGGLKDEDEEARLRFMRARGMLDVSSSDEDGSETDSDAGVSEDSEEAEARMQEEREEWGVGAMAANPEEPIPLIDETNRIAIVDLDWDHVKAVDIFAVLRSFCPKGGEVTRVTVYPSDYGLQRMAEEVALGPKGVFVTAAEPKEQPSKQKGGDDDDEGAEVDKRRLALYERSKLRYFYAVAEFDRVATAAAVYAECDGLEFERSACKFDLRFVPDEQSFEGRQVRDTATALPSGYEAPHMFNQSLQSTNPKLSWDADDGSRKRVLQKKLTEDEIKQADFEAYLGSDEEGDDDDDGGNRDDDKNPEKLRERYRALLLGGGGEAVNKGSRSWGAGDEEEDEGEESDKEKEEVVAGKKGKRGPAGAAPRNRIKGQDGTEMEVTFVSGLENLGEKLLSKKREQEARKGETVWEAYLRKKKEKRRDRRQERKARRGQGDSDTGDDDDVEEEGGPGSKTKGAADEEDPFDDPFFKDEGAGVAVSSGEDDDEAPEARKQSKAQDKPGLAKVSKEEKRKVKEEERQRQAELELLLMDDGALRAGVSGRGLEEEDDDEGAGAGKKKMSRKERLRLKKEQRRAARQGSDDEDAQRGQQTRAEGQSLNLEDPRFAVMFKDHDFALDPTDPRFAKMKTADALAKEMSKRRISAPAPTAADLTKQQQPAPTDGAQADGAQADKLNKLELKAMVAKLKRKGDATATNGTAAKRAK